MNDKTFVYETIFNSGKVMYKEISRIFVNFVQENQTILIIRIHQYL
jgi:hypothetical protein